MIAVMTDVIDPIKRDNPWPYATTPDQAKSQSEQFFAGVKLEPDSGWSVLPDPGTWEPPTVADVARRACVLSIIAAVGLHQETQQDLAGAVEESGIADWMTPAEQAMYLKPTTRATVPYDAMPDQIHALLYATGHVDLDIQVANPDDLIDLTPAGGKVTVDELVRSAARRPLDEIYAQLDTHVRFMRIEERMRADDYPKASPDSADIESLNAFLKETDKITRGHTKRFNRAKLFGGREKSGHPMIATYRAQAWAWVLGQCPVWAEWDLDRLVPLKRGV